MRSKNSEAEEENIPLSQIKQSIGKKTKWTIDQERK